MGALRIEPLRQELPFGVRISGVTHAVLADEASRRAIFDAFEREGLIVFDGIEQSDEMQVALSGVFGPLKEHPLKEVSRVDASKLPGVVEIKQEPNASGVVEIEGKQLAHWLPWHFDHCYNNELNRAGVLRATQITSEGGLTGFVDGLALYRAFPAELRDRLEQAEILYTLNVAYQTNRFGQPKTLRVIREKPGALEMMENRKGAPRAIHPAIWTRADGGRCLHVSPYMADGILGLETPEGEALLEDVCQTVNRIAATQSYHHAWRLDQMLIWDNWRMLHAVSGNDPALGRTMQRTTIAGDYGLGRFEFAPAAAMNETTTSVRM
ncbi:taurine dioxygenase [Novosphingobium sp. PhB165]|uniref:TauD/TfdA dioxygenase family protein n=1 Tax=Novosphingobium sp. PhB165 TaxID=2485105 RepID=UPI0010504680|nr:TauD/TfdA family dioxygenase [Novosphingobium sp. PhB165]TCM20787.1 taurine dioxygenase [Novosphingobium sp. PhB165]